MLHPSTRRAAALALSLVLLLPTEAIAAPPADTGLGLPSWAAAAWQRLLALVAPSETTGQPSTGSDLGPGIDPNGSELGPAIDPNGSDLGPDIDPDGSHLGPAIDPDGLEAADPSDLGPDIDPNG